MVKTRSRAVVQRLSGQFAFMFLLSLNNNKHDNNENPRGLKISIDLAIFHGITPLCCPYKDFQQVNSAGIGFL